MTTDNLAAHIRNIFTEGKLPEKSNLQKMQIANSDRPVVTPADASRRGWKGEIVLYSYGLRG